MHKIVYSFITLKIDCVVLNIKAMVKIKAVVFFSFYSSSLQIIWKATRKTTSYPFFKNFEF